MPPTLLDRPAAYLWTWRALWTGRLTRLRLRPEEKLAIQCQDYLRLKLPEDAIAFHIPNEAQRSKASWAVQQAMGFIAGLPDTMIIWHGRVFMIEYKAGKNKLTVHQEAVQEWAGLNGVPYVVVHNLDELITFFTAEFTSD